MKTKSLVPCLAWVLLIAIPCAAGVKEVKDSPVIRVENPNGRGEIQLRVQFHIPVIPESAHIDHVFLILDQKFELPLVADTSRHRPARDTMEVPKGLQNKSAGPLMLSVYGFDEASAGISWVDTRSAKEAFLNSAALLPVATIQAERRAGRWANEAIKFLVTQFSRDQSKKKHSNVAFVITGAAPDEDQLKPSKVDVDTGKLSGRLLIYYTEPPVLPPGIK